MTLAKLMRKQCFNLLNHLNKMSTKSIDSKIYEKELQLSENSLKIQSDFKLLGMFNNYMSQIQLTEILN